jgi:FkbM family methyltransferase
MFSTLKRLLKHGYNPDYVFDIGAYHGNWTTSAISIFPNAHYYMIEGINYNELKQYDNFSNLTVINEILNDKSGKITWYEMRNTGDSMFKERTLWGEGSTEKQRDAITLNDCLTKYNIDINKLKNVFIKIDCQGAELAILKGSSDIIPFVDFILMELPLFGQYNENVPSFIEHIKYMDSIGFIPYDIVDNHYINNFNMQIDMLFINKKHPYNQTIQGRLLIEYNENN